jgi:hypothetical protein
MHLRITYLTNQQPLLLLPLLRLEQIACFELATLNNPHALLPLSDIFPDNEGFNSLLTSVFIGVDEDIASSA